MKGRKRHIVTDVMGNLLAVVVHVANIHDTKSGINPARKAFGRYPTINKFCADQGYRKTFEAEVSQELGLCLDISKRIKPEFEILPKRWVVERTFAWLNGFCRDTAYNHVGMKIFYPNCAITNIYTFYNYRVCSNPYIVYESHKVYYIRLFCDSEKIS